MKQHTRNYAKRQMTWLRKEKDWLWMRPDDATRIIQAIQKHQGS